MSHDHKNFTEHEQKPSTFFWFKNCYKNILPLLLGLASSNEESNMELYNFNIGNEWNFEFTVTHFMMSWSVGTCYFAISPLLFYQYFICFFPFTFFIFSLSAIPFQTSFRGLYR